jgi:hypothetical protein
MSEYRKNIKLSNYLNNILEKNSRITRHNFLIAKKYRKPVSLEPLLHVPTEDELISKFGGHFENIKIIAKIGMMGTKIHKITIHAIDTTSGYIIYNAYSDCGSQKWSREGRSPIMPFESADLSLVNCDKCLGVRVKGGKSKEPSKRIPIDPMSRPRKFYFIFKVDSIENKKTRIEYSDASGMTEEEARNKIIRQYMRYGYYSKVYDFELQKILAWNYNRLWTIEPEKSKYIYSKEARSYVSK